MYGVGDVFNMEIDNEDVEISIIGEVRYLGDEFFIGEDEDGTRFAFKCDEEDEDIVGLVEDEDEASEVLETWESEYLDGDMNIGDWEGDSYYEREDRMVAGEGGLDTLFEIDEDEIIIDKPLVAGGESVKDREGSEEDEAGEDDITSFLSLVLGGESGN